MKKLILLLSLSFITISTYGQTYSNPYPQPVKVQVTTNNNSNNFSNSFTKGLQAGAAARSARAAEGRAEAEATKDKVIKARDPNAQYMNDLRKSGAMGAHKDKKKDAKAGKMKHKANYATESIKDELWAKLNAISKS